MIKILTLTFLIVGNFIGAGFASGKEIFSYFAKYGYISLFSVFLVFCLLNFLFKKCLYLGKVSTKNNLINKKIILFCSVITIAAMLSGTFSVGYDFSKKLAFILYLLFILLYIIVMLKGIGCISVINFILVPIMIFTITLNTILNFKFSTPNFNFLLLGNSITHSIVYVSMNMFSLGCFLISIANKFSYKEIKLASFLSSLILSILIFLVILCFNQNNITNYHNVPMQTLSKNISKGFYLVYSIVLLFSLFTTLISAGFVANTSIKSNKIKNKLFIPLIFSILISLLGFNFIVNYLYFIVGLFGFCFIFKLLINLKLTKTAKNQCFY